MRSSWPLVALSGVLVVAACVKPSPTPSIAAAKETPLPGPAPTPTIAHFLYAPEFRGDDARAAIPAPAVVLPIRECRAPHDADAPPDPDLKRLAEATWTPQLWAALHLPGEPRAEYAPIGDDLCKMMYRKRDIKLDSVVGPSGRAHEFELNVLEKQTLLATLASYPGRKSLVVPFWFLSPSSYSPKATVRNASGKVTGSFESSEKRWWQSGAVAFGVTVLDADGIVWEARSTCGPGFERFCDVKGVDRDYHNADAAAAALLADFPWSLLSLDSTGTASPAVLAEKTETNVTAPGSVRLRWQAPQILRASGVEDVLRFNTDGDEQDEEADGHAEKPSEAASAADLEKLTSSLSTTPEAELDETLVLSTGHSLRLALIEDSSARAATAIDRVALVTELDRTGTNTSEWLFRRRQTLINLMFQLPPEAVHEGDRWSVGNAGDVDATLSGSISATLQRVRSDAGSESIAEITYTAIGKKGASLAARGEFLVGRGTWKSFVGRISVPPHGARTSAARFDFSLVLADVEPPAAIAADEQFRNRLRSGEPLALSSSTRSLFWPRAGKPVFPGAATMRLMRGHTGEAVVGIEVGIDGKVLKTNVVSGIEPLTTVATALVQGSRFVPLRIDGSARSWSGEVTEHFRQGATRPSLHPGHAIPL